MDVPWGLLDPQHFDVTCFASVERSDEKPHSAGDGAHLYASSFAQPGIKTRDSQTPLMFPYLNANSCPF